MITHRSAIITPQRRANFELIEAIADSGNGLVDLWEASPIRLDSNEPGTDQIIEILFPSNPLLCCAWSRYRFDTRRRNDWHKLQDLQLIVPNPMRSARGLTRTGKPSAHALSNTSARQFIIVEFDFEEGNSVEEMRLLSELESHGRDVLDLSAALLLHLAEKAPLAMAVHSGGKSLHGWFYCAAVAENRLKRFFDYARSLGADHATWSPSQFVRMPDGLHDNGKRQTVYFFNPAVVK